MKESPLYFLASKAKRTICIIASCLDLPVYMVLVSKRLLPWAILSPGRSVSGDIALNFSEHPSQTSFISEELHKIMGSWTQVFHKSTETDIQVAIFFFYRCSKDQMTLDHFITCWNILGVIQGSMRSHPPKLTPLDMNTRC